MTKLNIEKLKQSAVKLKLDEYDRLVTLLKEKEAIERQIKEIIN